MSKGLSGMTAQNLVFCGPDKLCAVHTQLEKTEAVQWGFMH